MGLLLFNQKKISRDLENSKIPKKFGVTLQKIVGFLILQIDTSAMWNKLRIFF